MPFFSFSLSPLSLLTVVLSSSPSSSCLSSKTTDSPPSSRQFSFHLPSLGASSFSLFLHFFLFSLSLSLPSAIALSPPVSTSTTLTLQYYQHCQVHFCLHSPRSTSPTLEKRRETARFLTSTDQSSDRLLLGATILLSLRFSTDDESTIVSKHCRTIIICEYNWTMNRFVVPLQFKSLIYFKTKKNSERIDIPRHVINVYLC